MRIGLTEIIFLVDRSGSMNSIRLDMIGGFNSFIREQRKLPTECKVSFYQFDHGNGPIVEKVYEQTPVNAVPDLTTETFVPRGGTPLYDAVARVIREVEERISKQNNLDQPEKVLVVCITDGEENSSHEWTAKQVKQMIEDKQEKAKWEFVYLGANQDAWQVGQTLGVSADSTLGYVASKGGTNSMWSSLSDKTMKYRAASGATKFAFDANDQDAQKKEGYSH